AQLDKTFPTNDCSMCIEAPKMVNAARHPNIELLTYSELMEVDGEAGNFTAKVNKKARFVDFDKCIACGLCAEKCRLHDRIIDEYNEGLSKRSAIYVQFPQAVPLKYTIDPDKCIFQRTGKCGDSPPCSDVCPADAIDHTQKDETIELKVGSIIVSTGMKAFDPHESPEYGYALFKNVITSLEFERMLNASGPTGGHVQRISDEKTPEKIAFIQCVGSRDHRTNEYCSGVCCTYAVKEAMIAREHTPDLQADIFAMDIRTFGRGFEDFRIRAENDYGVRVIRNNRVPSLEETDKGNILLKYIDGGNIKVEEYDMVILSVGLRPQADAEFFAEKLGIRTNEYGFCETTAFDPLSTSRPGIFVSGVFQSPKDIPESVAQASGAAAKAGSVIADARNTLIEEKVYPEEIDVTDQEPRIGVIICHCGTNIAGVVDVKAVTEYAKTLPNVVYATDSLYSCSQDAQETIKDLIKKHKLNRVVISSCSPRTHEPLFQDTIREAGLNPYLFEMANIRDHCSWVHMHEPEKATQKSKSLTHMAVAKSALLKPLSKSSVETKISSLVLGGGLAGMTAALELSKQGFKVDLVERSDSLGGHLKDIKDTITGDDPQVLLNDLVSGLENDDNITIHKNTELSHLEGYLGNFISTLTDGTSIEHGTIIVATGGIEYKPNEYSYGQHPNIMTQMEFELQMHEGKIQPKSVAIIHCVGARTEENTECSRICCTTSIKTSLNVQKRFPQASVFNLYKDIRTYGFKEKYYQEAGEKGAIFIQYDDDLKPEVNIIDNAIQLKVMDNILGRELLLNPDYLILSSAVVADPSNSELAKMLKVPLGKDGFFFEAHVKLRPLDFATDGIFLCGMAQGPKFIDETISQSCGAVSRVCTILSKTMVEAGGVVSVVDEDACGGCGTCEALCPYGAIIVDMSEPTDLKAKVNEILCKGCGACVAACPECAISIKHFTDDQILAQIRALSKEVVE
ncbi:MAG: CoB--CoM heterodisulfide reductase iron-sulfur subunit A family protein, partial [Thermoplasmata archaeon]|nr:CoB--CoM heterodisulfide reductase iron-sulfur subunit A family protein [Thermoplasmata archaeon]